MNNHEHSITPTPITAAPRKRWTKQRMLGYIIIASILFNVIMPIVLGLLDNNDLLSAYKDLLRWLNLSIVAGILVAIVLPKK